MLVGFAPFVAKAKLTCEGPAAGACADGVLGGRLRDELPMVGQLSATSSITSAMSLEEPDSSSSGNELGDRVGTHFETLADQDLDPAFLGEQLGASCLKNRPDERNSSSRSFRLSGTSISRTWSQNGSPVRRVTL